MDVAPLAVAVAAALAPLKRGVHLFLLAQGI